MAAHKTGGQSGRKKVQVLVCDIFSPVEIYIIAFRSIISFKLNEMFSQKQNCCVLIDVAISPVIKST